MTPRRQQTNFVDNQPVRFYKFIALTFLVITIILFCVIVFMSSKEAIITVTTKPDPIDVNKYVVVGPGGDWESVVTTTLVSRTQEFSPTGTKEEPGIARGRITLINESGYDQPLVATTRLLSPEGILFRLKDRVLVPAGGEVKVDVYADEEGAGGNLGPVDKFTIPGLKEETQKVIYARSTEVMTGGTKTIGVLSTDDVKKAEIELLGLLEEEGKSLLEQLDPESKMVYKVVEQNIENDTEIGQEVSGFNLTGTATVLAIFYKEDIAKQEAMSLLNKRMVGDAENLDESYTYSVTIDSCDLEEGTAVLQLFTNGTVKLDPESEQLEKMIFYGKTKDEVRRYLLSLDHVKGVDIKFKPAWMRSVPHVAEHVQVIIKDVE